MIAGSVSVRIGAIDALTAPLQKMVGQIEALGGTAEAMGKRLDRIGKSMTAAVTLPVLGLGAAALKMAGDFGTAMAEVNTLVSDDSMMGPLTQSVKDLSKQFGKMPTEQAAALYQIISAGASTAAQATDILTASNKLAIGGVTDVKTAADGLTTILNAYGEAAGSAADVSDALFVAMKAGKTNISELSTSIGSVAPLAAQAGASLNQVLAATAALTKGGVTTSVAMNGLRAIMASVVKPSSEASKMAESLGLKFSAAALQAQGLAGFLQEVTQKTGGSTEKMAQLFGGVEALVPVLALTGKAAGDFGAIMESMGTKAGATEEAFAKMAGTAAFKMGQVKAELAGLGIEIGNNLMPAVLPLVEAVADLTRTFSALPAHVKTATFAFVGLAAVVGPLALTLKGIIAAGPALAAVFGVLTSPVALGVGAVALLGAGFAKLGSEVNKARIGINGLAQGAPQAAAAVAQMAAPMPGMLEEITVVAKMTDKIATGATKAKSAFELLSTRVGTLTGLFDVMKDRGEDTSILGGAMAKAYNAANAALRKQGDQLSENALILRQMLRDLERVKFASAGSVNTGMGATALPQISTEPIARFGAALGVINPAVVRMGYAMNIAGQGIREAAGWAISGLNQFASDLVATSRKGLDAGLGLAEALKGGLAMAVVMEVINGALQPLAPLITGILAPLSALGNVIGQFLAPVFRVLAIAASYLAEGLYRTGSFILSGIGKLMEGIGKLLNKLPGSIGNPLIALGTSMRTQAETLEASARAQKDYRKELIHGAEAVRSFAGSLNAVSGYRVQRATFNASTPQGFTPQAPKASATNTVTLNIHEGAIVVRDSDNPREAAREVVRELARGLGAIPGTEGLRYTLEAAVA